MNKKQRRVLVMAGIFIFIAFLLPPTYSADYGFKYRWIFGSWDGKIEVMVLLAEWVAICLLAGIGWLLCRDFHKS